MEQKYISIMKTNDSERMQPKGCKKTNENLTLKLIQEYHDEAKKKNQENNIMLINLEKYMVNINIGIRMGKLEQS